MKYADFCARNRFGKQELIAMAHGTRLGALARREDGAMRGTAMTAEAVLAALPQREPFRFVDEVVELDPDHIVARVRFRPEADFYRGHFPGNPVTPGVILIEAMAQAGVVALGIYLLSLEGDVYDPEKTMTLFTDASVDFSGLVRPGDRVTITAKKIFWRRRKLRAEAEMRLDDGSLVCSGTLSGMAVLR